MTTLPADLYSTKAPRHGQDNGASSRRQRGLIIAATVPLKRNRQGWTVPSQSGNGTYYATTDFCSCPDYETRAQPCKHIYAVRFAIEREEGGQANGQPVITQDAGKASNGRDAKTYTKPQAQVTDSLLTSATGPSDIIVPSDVDVCTDTDNHHHLSSYLSNSMGYGVQAIDGAPLILPSGQPLRDWSAYTRAQEMENKTFIPILSDLCTTIPERDQTLGRQAWPWGKVVLYICWKIFVGKAWRRSTDKTQHSEHKYGRRENPSWSALARYMQDPELTVVLTELLEHSASPFRSVEEVFAIDSTGFSTSVVENWNTYRYGSVVRSTGDPDHPLGRQRPSQRTLFVKTHLCCGARTNVITAAIVTATDSGDAPMLPMLLETTAKRFRLKEVLADKAYLAQYNLNAIHGVGALPFIPMKSNSIIHEGEDEPTKWWNALYHFFGSHRDAFLSHYHQRSNVETTMSMVKAKFSEHVRSRHPVARVNEVLAKLLCHNICQLNRLTIEFGKSFSWT